MIDTDTLQTLGIIVVVWMGVSLALAAHGQPLDSGVEGQEGGLLAGFRLRG